MWKLFQGFVERFQNKSKSSWSGKNDHFCSAFSLFCFVVLFCFKPVKLEQQLIERDFFRNCLKGHCPNFVYDKFWTQSCPYLVDTNIRQMSEFDWQFYDALYIHARKISWLMFSPDAQLFTRWFLYLSCLSGIKPSLASKPQVNQKPNAPGPVRGTPKRSSRLYPAPKDNTG